MMNHAYTPDPHAVNEQAAKQAVMAPAICLIVVASISILLGAIKMMRLQKMSSAKTACILALIPCIGPCFILGIPFGIWGLVMLNKYQVRVAFNA